MANIFEQKFDDGDVAAIKPDGRTMVAMTTAETPDKRPLPGERKNPEMAVRNITRPRFGFDY
jgi:hypothetical protein